MCHTVGAPQYVMCHTVGAPHCVMATQHLQFSVQQGCAYSLLQYNLLRCVYLVQNFSRPYNFLAHFPKNRFFQKFGVKRNELDCRCHWRFGCNLEARLLQTSLAELCHNPSKPFFRHSGSSEKTKKMFKILSILDHFCIFCTQMSTP